MYQTGKVYQVAKEMRRLELAIPEVSETRWTGAGKVHLEWNPQGARRQRQTKEVMEETYTAGA